MKTSHPGRVSAPKRHADAQRRRKATVRGFDFPEDSDQGVSADEWHDLVSTAAYYRAEARGFQNGSADEDWFEAEAELRERLGARDSDVEGESKSGGAPTDIETKGE